MKTIFRFGFLILCAFCAKAQSAKISVAELPTAARTFLNQHYKYRPIEYVRKKEQGGFPYTVKLAQGTQICFGENGDWCKIDGDGASLPKALVPTQIASYVKEKYPKKRITYIEKDNDKIDINLNNNVGLEFDAMGNLSE
ncbi:PepSY-like domain-containing protein [Flavobacterium selenitireducens]|uniref:PepSY-like domain-containing protein n=1 Tax=Flavobacterium selenitireducens TaxID=2722704 RepID=UPI00168C08EF|nr:PepSY-like domain-containing protein [Flavobacterium selenitireducens]MBD3582793.1 hypothetical protein [Flavobacterium selenitireducens]